MTGREIGPLSLLAPAGHLGNFQRDHEHGQDWLTCVTCGAQWSVVETSRGEDLEQVSDGDGYCEDHGRLVGAACEAAEAFDADDLEITRCSVCGEPAHDGETDEDRRCEKCRGGAR